jgi:hypothetical protein
MKASELRIGNWFNEDMTTGSYSQITAEQILDLYDDPLDDFYQPIPLTEEWLLKFGLEFVTDTWYLKGFAIWETECGDEKGNTEIGYFYELREVGMMDRHIKYVHELQNVYFALTREEL